MVGPCKIVAERLGGIAAEEDRPGVADLGHDRKGISGDDLKVLGRDRVGRFYKVIQAVADEDIAVICKGFLNDLFSGEHLQKSVDLVGNRLCERLIRRKKDRACHGIVLCLREKVRRDEPGVGRLVRDHKDLAGACDRVDAGHAKTRFFGKGYENVAGARDLVHLGNGLRAIGHSCDRLRAADLVDLCRARNVRSCNRAGRCLAVCTGGRAHDDLLNACHLGRDNIHQNAGGIHSAAAGHIAARNRDRCDLLPQDHAVLSGCDPAVSLLLFVIAADVLRRLLHDFDQFGIQRRIRLLDLFSRYAQRIGREMAFVELLAVFEQGVVAVLTDIVNDLLDGLLIIAVIGGAAADQLLKGLRFCILIKLYYSHTVANPL